MWIECLIRDNALKRSDQCPSPVHHTPPDSVGQKSENELETPSRRSRDPMPAGLPLMPRAKLKTLRGNLTMW
jgi:hypothetical protein